ncbi:MAG: patatin-like phospholipase family protein, partial [Muribaculaceae bacterium]|nr:patatin-like phospholipase family protein [Muribaculaceae bacterium]
MALLNLNNVSIDGILEFAGFRRNPTYGVAFAGGGVRGFAHVGVIKALEEYGIHPQVLSGVSAGSIAAVLYGAGFRPEDIVECFSELQRFGDFTEFAVPTSGFFRLDKFGKLLESWLPVKNLEELKIPTI